MFVRRGSYATQLVAQGEPARPATAKPKVESADVRFLGTESNDI